MKTGSDTNFVLNAGRTPYSLSLRYYKQNLSGSIGVQRQGILGKAGVFAQLGYGF